mmetsp:Transcript_16206/g.41715  ORF Transcript_16206/g.41715 Transcript_16206/m.41715 type:complete len:395 (+) Transcript_16206:403-1587(+)
MDDIGAVACQLVLGANALEVGGQLGDGIVGVVLAAGVQQEPRARPRHRGRVAAVEAAVEGDDAEQTHGEGHVRKAVVADHGQVHHPGPSEAIAHCGQLAGIHKVVRQQLGEGAMDLVHVLGGVGTMTARCRYPIALGRLWRVDTIDVRRERDIALLGQEVRPVLLVRIHAVPILDDHDRRALFRAVAHAGLVNHVAQAIHAVRHVGHVLLRVLRGHGGQVRLRNRLHPVFEELQEETHRGFPRAAVHPRVVHGLACRVRIPLREAVDHARSVARDLIHSTDVLQGVGELGDVRVGVVLAARVQQELRPGGAARGGGVAIRQAAVEGRHAQQALRKFDAGEALVPDHGQVHHAGASKAIAYGGQLGRVHKIVRQQFGESPRYFAHILGGVGAVAA